MKKILFVCTGNTYRSMTAEYCLRMILNQHHIKNIIINSAGIEAKPEAIHPTTLETLLNLGIDARKHRQTKVTKQFLKSQDIIIAMGKRHKRFLKSHFNTGAILFDELTMHTNTSEKDVLPTNKNIDHEIRKEVTHIFSVIPHMLRHIKL